MIKKLILGLATTTLVGCGQATQSSAPKPVAAGPAVETSPSSSESPAAPAPVKSSNLPTLPAGWQWISGVQTRIAVPTRYVGGSPENLPAIAAQLPETGMDETTLVALLGRYVGPANLFAIDRTTLTKAFPTNLSVALDGKPKTKDLDSYLATAVQELAGDWQVQKQEKVTLGNRQFARIQAFAKRSQREIAQKSSVAATIYITADAGKFWLLTFTAENNASNGTAQDFQQIAASLRSP